MAGATLTWLGHATMQATLPDERVVIFDPWFRDNPSCPDELKDPPRCDFLALTHGHFDHIGDAGRLIEKHNPHVVATFELCDVLGLTHPQARLARMNIGGTQTIDGVSFTLTRAFHSSSAPSENGPVYTGMPCGIVMACEGVASFYHAGDTDVFSDMTLIAELFAPKVVALPIGDHFTMGPAGAALAAKFLNPVSIVPTHYGTFPLLHGTPEAFREALSAELKPRLHVPKVGQPMEWTEQGLASA
jgi:L-ascorbate metabolism protein UlaG (beta-lactamase superfamily)